MTVKTQHPQYTKYLPRVQLVRDCVEGSSAIKSRPGTGGDMWSQPGARYLPPPMAKDTSSENKDRYAAYKFRAKFVNFTGSTKDGLMGMAFRKAPEIELSSELEYIKDNANGGGLSLTDMIQDSVGEAIETARYGILVDYPQSESGLTQAQVNALGLRGKLTAYPMESILNWKTGLVNGEKRLTMVVLLESIEEEIDEFESREVEQYRVLSLQDGIYTQRVYNKDEELIHEFTPTNSSGATWKEIPFIIIGAQNNDETIDKPVLYDIAEVNIGHYQNSADSEESSFFTGQPTLFIGGLSASWVKDVLKGDVLLGSRSAIPGPEGSSAELLQANPNQLPDTLGEKKEKQMVKLGALIIQDSTGVETAEAARIRFAGQSSKLALVITNVEKAFNKCLMWLSEFMGGTGEIKLNREFYKASVDPQLLMAQIQLLDRGVIGSNAVYHTLRTGEAVEEGVTDEDLQADAEQSGMGLGNMVVDNAARTE